MADTPSSTPEAAASPAAPFTQGFVPFADRLKVPGAPRRPTGNIGRSMVWLYGEPKIGKTTFASRFPGVWFVATEKGQDWVEVREPTLVSNWDEFLTWCAFIQEHQPTTFGDGTPIETIAIDTVDGLFRMCFDHVVNSLGVEDPGELPHGKGWTRLNAEFDRVMNKIRKWPYGLICISHVRSREVKARGRKMDRNEPNIGAAGARWCQSAADLILFAHAQEVPEINDKGEITGAITEKRVLRCWPSASTVAGGRMIGKTSLPEIVPLNYDEFIKYFNQEPPCPA